MQPTADPMWSNFVAKMMPTANNKIIANNRIIANATIAIEISEDMCFKYTEFVYLLLQDDVHHDPKKLSPFWVTTEMSEQIRNVAAGHEITYHHCEPHRKSSCKSWLQLGGCLTLLHINNSWWELLSDGSDKYSVRSHHEKGMHRELHSWNTINWLDNVANPSVRFQTA